MAKSNMFTRAAQQLPLTPVERSLLKGIESFVLTGTIAVLPLIQSLLNALTTGTISVNWKQEVAFFGLAFLVAGLHALAKYYKASGDLPIGVAMDTIANALPEPQQPVVRFPQMPPYVPVQPLVGSETRGNITVLPDMNQVVMSTGPTETNSTTSAPTTKG